MPFAPPATTPQKGSRMTVNWPDFSLGCGYFDHVEGGYAIGVSVDTRFGYAVGSYQTTEGGSNGATSFTYRAHCKHNNVYFVATSDGTDTKVFSYNNNALSLKLTVTAAVATDLFSFSDQSANSTLILFLGATVAFRYSTDNGANWTTSNLAGNNKYGNYGMVQSSGLLNARCVYVRTPGELYYAAAMVNGSTTNTATFIGTQSATDQYPTSVIEDDEGTILIGMRRDLWSVGADGIAVNVTKQNFHDPPADTSSGAGRRNFEQPNVLAGRVYYMVNGRDLLEYHHGAIRIDVAPKDISGAGRIGVLNRPITALGVAGNWLLLTLGGLSSAQTTTYSPGGAQLLQNLLANQGNEEAALYAGRYEALPDGTTRFVWHGALVTASVAMRGLFYDEDNRVITWWTIAGLPTNDITHLIMGFELTSHIASSASFLFGAWALESGRIGKTSQRWRPIRVRGKVPALSSTAFFAVHHRGAPSSNTTKAYVRQAQFTKAAQVLTGVAFPNNRDSEEHWIQFRASPAATVDVVLYSASMELAEV